MNNFKKPFNKFGGNKFGGKPRFDRNDRGGDRGYDRAPLELFHAVCANCGKSCQVPFKPNGKKPVFCKECFDKGAAGESVAPRPQAPRFEAPRRDFSSIASAPRPQAAPADSKLSYEIKKELEGVNQKLAQLIDLLAPKKAAAVSAPAQAEPAAPKAKKAASKKKTA